MLRLASGDRAGAQVHAAATAPRRTRNDTPTRVYFYTTRARTRGRTALTVTSCAVVTHGCCAVLARTPVVAVQSSECRYRCDRYGIERRAASGVLQYQPVLGDRTVPRNAAVRRRLVADRRRRRSRMAVRPVEPRGQVLDSHAKRQAQKGKPGAS